MNKLSIAFLPALLFASSAAWSQPAQRPQDQHQQHQSPPADKMQAEGKKMCCCDEGMMRQMMMKMMQGHQPKDGAKPAGADPAHKH